MSKYIQTQFGTTLWFANIILGMFNLGIAIIAHFAIQKISNMLLDIFKKRLFH